MTEQKTIKFKKPELVYKYEDNAKWDTQDNHPRFMGDVDGDGRADIIGFSESGVEVLFSDGETFSEPKVTPQFKPVYWRSQNIFPRVIGDINGDGKADIMGFSSDGSVWAMTSKGRDGFNPPYVVMDKYISNEQVSIRHTWSEQNLYPRMLADVNGDGWADIVGFGADGVWASYAIQGIRGAEKVFFAPPALIIPNFGTSHTWESQDRFPRFMADFDNDKKADIIGFGKGKVFVAYLNGESFPGPQIKNYPEFYSICDHPYNWESQTDFPIAIGDVNGDKSMDVVGFLKWGTVIMTSKGQEKGFNPPYIANFNFGTHDTAWGNAITKPRAVADVNGDKLADIISFAPDGVYVSFTQRVSPNVIDLDACERYSPNIEAKCMENAYNKAMKQIDESKMNIQAIQDAKNELIQSYYNYAGFVVHQQNTKVHFLDDTIKAKETEFISAMDKVDPAVKNADLFAVQQAARDQTAREQAEANARSKAVAEKAAKDHAMWNSGDIDAGLDTTSPSETDVVVTGSTETPICVMGNPAFQQQYINVIK